MTKKTVLKKVINKNSSLVIGFIAWLTYSISSWLFSLLLVYASLIDFTMSMDRSGSIPLLAWPGTAYIFPITQYVIASLVFGLILKRLAVKHHFVVAFCTMAIATVLNYSLNYLWPLIPGWSGVQIFVSSIPNFYLPSILTLPAFLLAYWEIRAITNSNLGRNQNIKG